MNKIAKALTGALVAGSGALGTAASDGVVSAAEWYVVAGTALAALLAVYRVPNKV